MTTRQDQHGSASHHGHERWAVIALLTVLGLVITALDVVAPRPAAAADADVYEPDDSAASARPFAVDGPAEQHTIAPDADDQDWVSFAVAAGATYLLETTGGSPDEAMDTVLRLYDADGSTSLAYDDDGGAGVYSRIEYSADASKTVFARVTGFDSGAYALSVTSVVPPGSLTGPANGVNFGNVLVGSTKQVTIQVQNTGGGPVTVGQVSLSRPGWSIVRNEVVGTIPAGATRELVVRYAPTTAYQGAPVAEYHEWTNLVAQYLYSGGVLYGAVVYSGFQNTGGSGVLPWHVTACQPSSPAPCNPVFNRSGSAAVVAGGRYNVRTVISAVPGTGRVALLAPVTDSVSLNARPSGLSGLTYVRVPDAYVTIESDDPDSPTYVDLFGVALKTSAEVPGRMRAPKVVVRGKQAIVKWTAADPNGSRITRYKVDISKGKDRTLPASARKTVFKNLKPGLYKVRITARNAIGVGPYSPWTRFRIR